MSISIHEIPLEVVWQKRHEVMYPELSMDAVKLPHDAGGMHLGLSDEGTLSSVISLFQREQSLQFRKFATVTAMQGSGYGTRLLQHVFQLAGEKNISSIWCNARITALALYQKFGMEPFGETWEEHGHQFIKMKIEL